MLYNKEFIKLFDTTYKIIPQDILFTPFNLYKLYGSASERSYLIFDNLDEKNIPILKKNCDRAKGISAKLKTNQNSKSLLMSEHVCQP